MKKYYYNSPRGFSNEYSIISVDQNNEKEVKRFEEYQERYEHFSDTNWDLHEITKVEADECIKSNRKLRDDYRNANISGYVGATDIIDATMFFDLV